MTPVMRENRIGADEDAVRALPTWTDTRRMNMRLCVRRPLSPIALVAFMIAGISPLSLQADYLKNSDLSKGFACWHGDGDPAFLNPDGTEADDGDNGAVAVIKIPLSKGESRAVYQEYETKDNPKGLHVHVEVYASDDFKRSAFASDYSSDINWRSTGTYKGDQETPNADFWIHDMPSAIYKLADLVPGQWVTVDCAFDVTSPTDGGTVYFAVPPGEGTIYIRNPSMTP